MSKVGFALRAEYEEDYQGGVIAYGPDAHSFNVKEALDAGDGTIVTDDVLLISALDSLGAANGPLLKRVQANKDDPVTPLPTGSVGTTESGKAPPTAVPAPQEQAGTTATETPKETPAEHDEASGYAALTVSELRDTLRERDIQYRSTATHDELVAQLEADDEEGQS